MGAEWAESWPGVVFGAAFCFEVGEEDREFGMGGIDPRITYKVGERGTVRRDWADIQNQTVQDVYILLLFGVWVGGTRHFKLRHNQRVRIHRS